MHLMKVETKKELESRWKNAKRSFKITHPELVKRVQKLRQDLELQAVQILSFGFELGDDPRVEQALDVIALVENINPSVAGRFNLIDTYCREHGTHRFLDFNAELYSFKAETAETAYKIGILAGVIFAGGSGENIDRFERALALALEYGALE